MSINRYIKTNVSNELINLLRRRQVQQIGIVAPSANALVAGQVYRFTSPNAAFAVVGADSSLGNHAAKIIEDIYAANSQSVIFYSSPGTNALGGTTDTVAGAFVATHNGNDVLPVTTGGAFAVGEYVQIGTGATAEYRKVLAIGASDITVTCLDFDHADLEVIEDVTQYSQANLAVCRTALEKECFNFYLEDSYGEEAAIKTFVESRDLEELFTFAFIGYDFGDSQATAIARATTANSKYILGVHGLITDSLDGRTYAGVRSASKLLAEYAFGWSNASVENNVLKTLSLRGLINVTRCVDNETCLPYTNADLDNIVCGFVSAIRTRKLGGAAAIVWEKVVTTYQLDEFALPSDTYTRIICPNGEVYMREDLSFRIDQFLQEANSENPPNPVTSNSLVRLEARVESILDGYTFLDRNEDTGGFEPRFSVFSPAPFQACIEIEYKMEEVIDQIKITLFKQIR